MALVMTLMGSNGHMRFCVYYYTATDCLSTIPLHYLPDLLSSAAELMYMKAFWEIKSVKQERFIINNMLRDILVLWFGSQPSQGLNSGFATDNRVTWNTFPWPTWPSVLSVIMLIIILISWLLWGLIKVRCLLQCLHVISGRELLWSLPLQI